MKVELLNDLKPGASLMCSSQNFRHSYSYLYVGSTFLCSVLALTFTNFQAAYEKSLYVDVSN